MSPIPGRLRQFVDAHPSCNDKLPLVHSTLCETLGRIATGTELTPQDCPVFQEPLIYLFYGRPAYRSHKGYVPDTRIPFCPICFVFKPNFVVSVKRIYPFDSGACAYGMLEPHIERTASKCFELTPQVASAQRASHLFFATNRAYFVGEPRGHVALPSEQLEAACLYRLLSDEGPAEYDDRRSSIEIQVDAPLSLVDTLWAVILPMAFLDDSEIRHTVVQKWGAYPLTYSTVRGSMPAEYAAVIREKLRRFLEDGGLL